MSGKPKLHYFSTRGRAELIRLVFAASGTDFEDKRYTWEEWPAHKKNAPTGVMPYVETPDKGTLVEGGAIARYYAKKAGLMGSNDWEYYLIERVLGQVEDVLQEFIKIIIAPQDKKAEVVKEFQAEKGPRQVGSLVQFLKDGGDAGFYVGNAVSLADLCSITMFDTLSSLAPELAGKYPELQQHRQRVLAACPKVAEWIKNRPETPI